MKETLNTLQNNQDMQDKIVINWVKQRIVAQRGGKNTNYLLNISQNVKR